MENHYTGKDYMMAAFGKGTTDRIAVRAMQSFRPLMQQAGLKPKDVATQPDKYVKGLQVVMEVSPADATSVLASDPALLAETAGLSFQKLKTMGSGEALLSDKAALGKLQLKDAAQYERLGYFTEVCRLAVEAMPDKIVDVTVSSPWSTAMRLRGMETMIYDTNDDPDFVHALLRYTTDLCKTLGDAILDTGVGLVTMGDPSAGCSVISPPMFRQWARPYIEETVRHLKAHGDTPVFLHICGYTDPILEDLVELGIDGLSIDAPASLAKLVGISQGRITVEGNFPGELYIEGTREQIEAKVRESIATAAAPNGYRYILCSGCQVPESAPLENVNCFLESGMRYGKRPAA